MTVHVQFRLDPDTVEQLDALVAQHAADGREITRHVLARNLVRAALGQPKQRAVANELVQLTWNSQQRIVEGVIEKLEAELSRLAPAE